MTTPLHTLDASPDGRPGTRRRTPPGVRKFGYSLSILINAALIYALVEWPGWRAVPFLTDRTVLVLPIVVASLVAGLAVNATWLVADPPWWRALGDAVTGAFVVAVGARLWQVFPFDFGDQGTPWNVLTRILLAVITVGTAVGVVASCGRFAVSVVRPDRHPPA